MKRRVSFAGSVFIEARLSPEISYRFGLFNDEFGVIPSTLVPAVLKYFSSLAQFQELPIHKSFQRHALRGDGNFHGSAGPLIEEGDAFAGDHVDPAFGDALLHGVALVGETNRLRMDGIEKLWEAGKIIGVVAFD